MFYVYVIPYDAEPYVVLDDDGQGGLTLFKTFEDACQAEALEESLYDIENDENYPFFDVHWHRCNIHECTGWNCCKEPCPNGLVG